MSLPEPRANPYLWGHEAAEAVLVEALLSGRMHHAWLLLGPAGIGKATLAFRLARRLLAGGRAPTLALPETSPTFRRVAAGTHADLLTIARELNDKGDRLRSEIVAETVRGVAEFLHLTPAEGGWRVVVIDDADFLNRHAANALLKVLEEPPPRALLILVCAAVGRLLPTIRSRCRRLRLDPLPPEAMGQVLAQALPEASPQERERLAGLGAGSPGRALSFAEEGGIAMAELASRSMARPHRLTTPDALAAYQAIGRDDTAFATFMDLLRGELATAVREAARNGAADNQGWLSDRPLDAWVAAWLALGRLRDQTLGLHLDKCEAVVQGFAVLAGRLRPDAI